jgi:hypothetical protein
MHICAAKVRAVEAKKLARLFWRWQVFTISCCSLQCLVDCPSHLATDRCWLPVGL